MDAELRRELARLEYNTKLNSQKLREFAVRKPCLKTPTSWSPPKERSVSFATKTETTWFQRIGEIVGVGPLPPPLTEIYEYEGPEADDEEPLWRKRADNGGQLLPGEVYDSTYLIFGTQACTIADVSVESSWWKKDDRVDDDMTQVPSEPSGTEADHFESSDVDMRDEIEEMNPVIADTPSADSKDDPEFPRLPLNSGDSTVAPTRVRCAHVFQCSYCFERHDCNDNRTYAESIIRASDSGQDTTLQGSACDPNRRDDSPRKRVIEDVSPRSDANKRLKMNNPPLATDAFAAIPSSKTYDTSLDDTSGVYVLCADPAS